MKKIRKTIVGVLLAGILTFGTAFTFATPDAEDYSIDVGYAAPQEILPPRKSAN